ncbi:hypothetical protein FPV67DRAFT_1025632 [Lyophyllum atratum]|nr:hypothetical protein FPV67DRAFT_1025632 [Lyophyllum atratum]
MSSTHSQTRSSIDLGVGKSHANALAKTKVPINHPPRLQHSPSLPNIWFPPHSGPIPPEFEEIFRQPLQRPSTPPSVESNGVPTSSTNRTAPQNDPEHVESFSFDDLATNLQQTAPLKIQRRRRIDRDQGYGHSLLTPPLTPSSSLRTTTSVDSAGNTGATSEAIQETHLNEADYQSTRFLLLSNISRKIRHDILRTSIVGSLTSLRVDASDTSNSLSVPASGIQVGPLTEDSIKGVFLRRQQSDGMAMLAFFDVRHAEVAKQIISAPTTGPLSHCVGDDIREDGTRAWITCQFITAEELVKVIGNSPFLASTDGSFYLAVEAKGMGGHDHGRELRVMEDHSVVVDDGPDDDATDPTSEDAATSAANGELNLSMLKSFLKSFGGLRSFSSADDKVDVKQPQVKTFRIDYYDVRCAVSAYSSIDGQILFGMKLRVFGREDLSEFIHARQQPQEHPYIQSTAGAAFDASKNRVIFPTTLPGHPGEAALYFGPPGQYSHTRERFRYITDAQSRPRSVSEGQDVFVNPVPRSPAPSPPYFYTSHPVENIAIVTSSHENLEQSHSNDALYSAPGGLPSHPPEQSFDRAHGLDGRAWTWEAESNRHSELSSYHDCYYCPSRGSPSSATSDCYVPCSTPSPYSQQPERAMQPPQNVQFMPQPPPAPGFGYEYDTPYPQPMYAPPANMANLNFEHAMTMVPRSFVGETWYPEAPGMVHPSLHSVPYGGPQTPIIGGPNNPYISANRQDTPLHFDPAAEAYQPIFRSTLPPSSPHPSRVAGATPGPLQGPSVSARESRATIEHNQLNISRIEDGQDTRTTVMIKNIPNKMSDKDLIAYIGKVSSRKIDFLYLRMDFQNGCNVGYAFVNFITVQDLLFFAKRKLGEKWNMFSSEKVLQMSYANYQGKEALVEKFKNSCIMDEREAWRPKIFYSDPGPEQGLPEPFPAPTHIRRKERSAFNRGALYVPGVGRGTPIPQSAYSRRLEDTRRNAERHGQSSEQTNPGLYPTAGTPRRRTNTKL